MKTLVLGYFASHSHKIDGQIAKTKCIYELLEGSSHELDLFDTELLQHRRLAIFTMLQKVAQCDALIYLPARGNLRILLPIIYLVSLLARTKIFYFVVGGWLTNFLRTKPLHRAILRRIEGIYSEIDVMSRALRSEYGFENVSDFPNFRIVPRAPFSDTEHEQLRIVYFARIMPEKGIDTLFEIARELRKGGQHNISIDIYGDLCYSEELFQRDLALCDNVTYRGVADMADVNSILPHYDIMLFPTHYDGEGCPGTIVDALLNGVAILCSDWRYNSSFVESGVNGYLCSPYLAQEYLDRIIALNQDRKTLMQLRRNAYSSGARYTLEHASMLIEQIIR